MPQPIPSILLIEDHNLVASGIAALLRNHGHRVSTARNLASARDSLAAEHFDLLLLDINLGHENGLDLLNDARHTKVILLSGTSEPELVFKAFELGAFGFIPKSIEPEELPGALAEMLDRPSGKENGWAWDPVRHKIACAQECFPKETLLTAKEREVFFLMREGKLDKQIADELGLSIHTIRVHLRAIKRKRGHNRRFEQAS